VIENLIKNIHGLWRAESTIADLRFRQLLTGAMLKSFAGLIAVFGLLMLDLTAFFALDPYFGRAWSAALVSLCDFLIAGILLIVAAMPPRSGELTLALEARQATLESFQSDAHLIEDRFSTLSTEITSIKTSVANFTKHPLDETLSQLIVPLSAALIRSLGKKKSPESAQPSVPAA
jgi:putative superfamily III holin-X